MTDTTLESSTLNEQKEEWQGEVTEIALTCNLADKVRLLQWSNRRRSARRGQRPNMRRVRMEPGMSHAVSFMLRHANGSSARNCSSHR
jgi:hypothetical protein